MNEKLAGLMPKKISTEIMLLIVLLIMSAFLTITTNSFLTYQNLTNLIRQTSINGIIALGMTFVVISGGIDLSVGSTVGFSGVLAALFMAQYNMSIPASIFLALLLGTSIGLINGVVIFDGKVPPFIATLGCMTAVRGLIMLITGARMISGIPRPFLDFAQLHFLGLPRLSVVWIAIILASAFILKFTTFGRNVYAVGSNVEAARLSGINIRLTTYAVYIYCAFLSSVAGILMTARLGNGIPTGGTGYETDAIASAVIGGASLAGAEGTVIGTVFGSVIMQMLRNGGNLLGVNSFILEIAIGLLIIFAVLVDKRRVK